jgi:hypothetical protein
MVSFLCSVFFYVDWSPNIFPMVLWNCMTLVWREKTGLTVGCYANFNIGYTVIFRLVVAHCLKSFPFFPWKKMKLKMSIDARITLKFQS